MSTKIIEKLSEAILLSTQQERKIARLEKRNRILNKKLQMVALAYKQFVEDVAMPMPCGCMPCMGQCRSQASKAISFEELQNYAQDLLKGFKTKNACKTLKL